RTNGTAGGRASGHDVGRAPEYPRGRVDRARSGPRDTARSPHWRDRRDRRRGHPAGLSRCSGSQPVLARLLVVLFAVIVVVAGFGIAYFVLSDSTPMLSALTPLADPTAAMDPSDTSKQV